MVTAAAPVLSFGRQEFACSSPAPDLADLARRVELLMESKPLMKLGRWEDAIGVAAAALAWHALESDAVRYEFQAAADSFTGDFDLELIESATALARAYRKSSG